jgi:restriction system protein
MTIPGFQDLMLPVLTELAARGESRTTELVAAMADRFGLSAAERVEMLPSGKQAVIANRTHWAIAYLTKTGLIQPPQRAHYMLDQRGQEVLAENPDRVDLKFLGRFPELAVFRGETADAPTDLPPMVDATPDEIIASTHKQIEAVLRNEVIDRILQREPAFFEALVMKVLVAMGYGGGSDATAEVIGGAGDEGVDVVVRQDALGLDRVYVQAKRYARDKAIGPSTVHALAGSLGIFKASKGLLVTTARFTAAAIDTAERVSHRIVLIDGEQLAALMIRFNVGVRIEETFHIKKIDEDFFLE